MGWVAGSEVTGVRPNCGLGPDAEETKSVPPSPWVLGVTIYEWEMGIKGRTPRGWASLACLVLMMSAAWASFLDACVLQRASARWPCLAGQDSRGWGRVRGLVPFPGERAGEIGTDGEAAVQAGETQ